MMMMSPFGDSASFGVRCSLGICGLRGIGKHGRRARSNTLLQFFNVQPDLVFHFVSPPLFVGSLDFLEGRGFSPASECVPTLSPAYLEGVGAAELKPALPRPETEFFSNLSAFRVQERKD